MKTEITNQRTVVDISLCDSLSLTGSATIQDGKVTSMNGQFMCEGDYAGNFAFSYSSTNKKIYQNLDITSDYQEEAERLIKQLLTEIHESIN